MSSDVGLIQLLLGKNCKKLSDLKSIGGKVGGVLDEQIQTVIKPRFYPRLCQFLTKMIPVINCVCACVRTSPEVPNDFI